jgi:hypothetical protein
MATSVSAPNGFLAANAKLQPWSSMYPVLSLRKDIWTHFPVILVPLGKGNDGAERHAVAWHRKRLALWRGFRPQSYGEWMDFEECIEDRLMKSLRLSARWVVEPPQSEDQICIIRMLYGDQSPASY